MVTTAAQCTLLGLAAFTAWPAVVDLRTRHIPNQLILVGLAFGVSLHLLAHWMFLRAPDQSWLDLTRVAAGKVVLGGLLCGLVPLLLFRAGAMGGGDVKLLAVVGAAAGPMLGMQIQLYAFVLLTLYAPARLAYEGRLMRMLGNSAALVANPFLPKARRRDVPAELMTALPFAPAVFVAALLSAVQQVVWP